MGERPKPDNYIFSDDGTIYYLAAAYSLLDVADEAGYTLDEVERFEEHWLAPRWVTDVEQADEDVLYDLFGDWQEWRDDPPDVAYPPAAAGTPGAHKYLSVIPVREALR